ncbi:Desumoylating isopeptidase 1 [Pseudolycoriella hygida]|uniref:Desumoylating isopeptidase 1 n=1 Tax=Pseudolycoriella hygida TaxID=35572 RepID=A0A9Q0MTY2_9DIPT|nr:Desumoylating isopeptidase 1 [Pseudolycoriella hygida]
MSTHMDFEVICSFSIISIKAMDSFTDNHTVDLYIYDLTQGMARVMSQMILGRVLDGVWHTGVVVYGREYFFGSQGIQSCPPLNLVLFFSLQGGTVLGQPLKIEKIGETFIPYQVFKDYIRGLSESTFRLSSYSLLKHNCNSFSEDLCQFLCGTSIPKYILDLPQEFLSTPLGQTLGPLIDRIGASSGNNFSFEPQISARETSPGFDELNNQIEEARLQSLALEEKRKVTRDKLAKKEKKKDKKKKKLESNGTISSGSEYNSNSNMSEVESPGATNGTSPIIPSEMLPSERVLEDEAKERQAEEERRKNREPPVVFTNIDAKVELEALVKLVDGQLSKDEETSIEELHQYLIEGEGSWALGDNFLVFVGRILQDPNISTETRVHLLRALAFAALKDDIILLLHQDRRDHVLMNYAQDIDRRAPEEQQGMALFVCSVENKSEYDFSPNIIYLQMCNLFENVSSSEWLLYISEWTYNNTPTSNIRATTKLSVHCLLAACPTLQEIGSAIIHNLACKEVKTVVFDDVAIELTMALLQFFNSKPSEEHLFRTLKALSKFVQVSPDIPQLVQMIGPHPNTFKGTSPRVDQLIEEISKKVR